MKRKKKTFLYLLLAASLTFTIVIGSWILNVSIHNARAAEEEKVVSESSSDASEDAREDDGEETDKNTIETDTVNASSESRKEEPSDSNKNANLQIAEYVGDYVIIDKPVPGDKDLSMEEAGLAAASLIEEIYDVTLDNGRMEMQFNGIFDLCVIERDIWTARYYPIDSHAKYMVTIDSVTGRLYHAKKVYCTQTADYLDLPSMYDEYEMETLLDDHSYEKLARGFVESNFPDMDIASSRNLNTLPYGMSFIRNGTTKDVVNMSLYNIQAKVVKTAVETELGSAYCVNIGWKTKEILEVQYFPYGLEEHPENGCLAEGMGIITSDYEYFPSDPLIP